MKHDLTGKTFGRLTIIKEDSRPTLERGGRAWWVCRCSCGNTKTIKSKFLLSGGTKSCGCFRREKAVLMGRSTRFHPPKKQPHGVAALRSLISVYKRAAMLRRVPFVLSEFEFKTITSKNCHYCGISPKQEHKGGPYTNGSYFYNGIDRIDSEKGYEQGNTLPCCGICNRAKRAMKYEDFLKWIDQLTAHRAALSRKDASTQPDPGSVSTS